MNKYAPLAAQAGGLSGYPHMNDPEKIEQTSLEANEVIKARVLLEDIMLKVKRVKGRMEVTGTPVD